ncbi:YaaL family protein [Gracilibacillus marinus]|jgi:hypothetical protein|uniref:YaaL family protein n=1 Tax=Gracilibacillus marinus TaxID=630535 RepID=A0ABV8VTE5_9BACI
MLKSKKVKKSVLDQDILTSIQQLKSEWDHLESIMYRSIEPSEKGQFDLAVTKAKYLYLIKEAKYRSISAN